MSLAERTREAARRHPWLIDALGAGVVNYTEAARFLNVDGDTDAVATALRRYATDLSAPAVPGGDATVSMHRGLERIGGDAGGEGEAPLLTVAGEGFVADGGSLTGVSARGEVDPTVLGSVLGRLSVAEVPVEAAGASEQGVTVVVPRRHGADALRVVEAALSS